MTRGPKLTLQQVVARLAKMYSPDPQSADPLSMLVWDNVGYLIDDRLRNELFAEFAGRIGLKAHAIANAPMPVLTDIVKRGGMHPQLRAERLKEIGRLAISTCDGDIVRTLTALPLGKAKALLRKFPSVGEPGADRVMLFAGVAPLPCVDSNGLRALVRLGFSREEKSYAQSYRRAVETLTRDGLCDADWLKDAYLLLRAHGKSLCKRSAPICEPCPFDRQCAHTLTATL